MPENIHKWLFSGWFDYIFPTIDIHHIDHNKKIISTSVGKLLLA